MMMDGGTMGGGMMIGMGLVWLLIVAGARARGNRIGKIYPL